jgi:hypothetical protein
MRFPCGGRNNVREHPERVSRPRERKVTGRSSRRIPRHALRPVSKKSCHRRPRPVSNGSVPPCSVSHPRGTAGWQHSTSVSGHFWGAHRSTVGGSPQCRCRNRLRPVNPQCSNSYAGARKRGKKTIPSRQRVHWDVQDA